MNGEDQAATNRDDIISAATEEEQLGPDTRKRSWRFNEHDRTEPLDHPSQEAVAQFLAAPEGMREFPSVTALAERLKISRATIYRWEKDVSVLRRVEHLSMQNKVAGDLFVRREWLPIMQKAVEKAKSGDVQAMKFCAACAWPESSGVGQGLSPYEALRATENEGTVPPRPLDSWAAEEDPAQEPEALSEGKIPPEPIS
jgi:hypothetical protein